MKRIYITIAAILAACSLAGCTADAPLNSDIVKNGALAANTAPDIINTKYDKKTEEIPMLKAKVKEWDVDRINELFIEPRTDLVHTEYPGSFPFNDSYDVYLGDESGDAYWLVYENGRLLAETRRDFDKYGYGTLASGLHVYSFGEYYNDNEIGLFPKEDAVSRTNELLDKLGIKGYSEPEVYAITADKANADLSGEWNDKNGISHSYEKWTADDEVYILRYSLEYNNIPLTNNFQSDIGGVLVGSDITAIVTKDEILSLDAFNILSDEYEVGESINVKCTREQAIEMADKYFKATNPSFENDDSDVKLLGCEIVYMPINMDAEGCCTLVPMWKVDISYYSEYSFMRGYDCVFINVSTGAPLTNGRVIY